MATSTSKKEILDMITTYRPVSANCPLLDNYEDHARLFRLFVDNNLNRNRVAELEQIAPKTVTQRIRKLKGLFGDYLYNRYTRHLTPFGQQLYQTITEANL